MVRQRSAKPLCPGSNPGGASKKKHFLLGSVSFCVCVRKDTTSFCGETANIIWPLGQHHSACGHKTMLPYGKQCCASHKRCGLMPNDVALRANVCYTKQKNIYIKIESFYSVLRLINKEKWWGKDMKKICLIIISVILSFTSCSTSYETNSEHDLPTNNSQSDIDTSKYIIQTPFYQAQKRTVDRVAL